MQCVTVACVTVAVVSCPVPLRLLNGADVITAVYGSCDTAHALQNCVDVARCMYVWCVTFQKKWVCAAAVLQLLAAAALAARRAVGRC